MGTHPIFESDFDCLTSLGTRLCSGSRLLVNRVSPIQSSFARNAIPKSLQRTQLVLTRAFGGGSVGVQKVITVFGFMGGISIFMALAANALGLNTMYFFYAFLALCTWMFFGESNMGKHQVVGQSNLQEIHTLFTLCFLPVLYLLLNIKSFKLFLIKIT